MKVSERVREVEVSLELFGLSDDEAQTFVECIISGHTVKAIILVRNSYEYAQRPSLRAMKDFVDSCKAVIYPATLPHIGLRD